MKISTVSISTLLSVLVFAAQPLLACLEHPPNPPRVIIERHSATEAWVIICDYVTFGSNAQNWCACALDTVGVITEVKSVAVTDTSCNPIPGFEFEQNDAVEAGFEDAVGGNWAGFLAPITEQIPPRQLVKIKFEVCFPAEATMQQLVESTQGMRIATDEATPEGVPRNTGHFSVEQVGTVTGVGEPDRLAGAINIAPNPLFAGNDLQIDYALLSSETVAVDLVNALGQVVASHPAQRQAAGQNQVALATAGLTPGLYFVRLTLSDGVGYMQKIALAR